MDSIFCSIALAVLLVMLVLLVWLKKKRKPIYHQTCVFHDPRTGARLYEEHVIEENIIQQLFSSLRDKNK